MTTLKDDGLKVYSSAAEALAGIVHDGQLPAVGGFGLCGIPQALIKAASARPHRYFQQCAAKCNSGNPVRDSLLVQRETVFDMN